MHIGLIGGIGPAATDYYYRRLIAAFAHKNKTLDLTMVHADTSTLLGNLASHNSEAQVAIYNRLTERLASAGAGCVVVTSIAGHFCIEAFKRESSLDVIDMLEAVDASIIRRGLKRVGILGTKTVMESRFYSALSETELVVPQGGVLEDVHSAYVAMAASGEVTGEQRAVFDSACRWMVEQAKVETILLGGTDLALVYREGQGRFPVVDCAAIHVDAIVDRATR